ncbi:MAG TPA: bifunctional diaminohydroxyphosphoribosylaminopyrimidine deaminase/5-amino-6-(5-phosphoribosylamino)uracil reductase RibD, partial [Gemmatimonadales bacterium]|nr:bifunctional diaminohydroxyphosphoribosylaminopyrimidine deaminase/5-amino-6-(5-phosphoribosylamino)uracil reductase RibD [Gemmatimonadales bacterium]
MNDLTAMDRALELAWRGWGRVAPNPLVGAVLVRGGTVVGEGWHAEYGGLHAEAAALQAAGEAARGATIYSTLEPCNHQGKQGPCTEALLAAGVTRVVAAATDPNPVAAGGAERLRGAGVSVEVGVRDDRARAQNAIFFHQFRQPSRPFIALKLATTLDGHIADASGRSRWISGPEARDYVHWLRAGFDAIGVGGHTARFDDAQLTVRGPIRPRREPRRVIFTRHGDLPPSLRLVTTAAQVPTILVTESHKPSARHGALTDAGVQIMRADSLADALEQLKTTGIASMLIEGGGRLAGALLAQGLVDRYYWIQSPVWLGGTGIPAISGMPGTTQVVAVR